MIWEICFRNDNKSNCHYAFIIWVPLFWLKLKNLAGTIKLVKMWACRSFCRILFSLLPFLACTTQTSVKQQKIHFFHRFLHECDGLRFHTTWDSWTALTRVYFSYRDVRSLLVSSLPPHTHMSFWFLFKCAWMILSFFSGTSFLLAPLTVLMSTFWEAGCLVLLFGTVLEPPLQNGRWQRSPCLRLLIFM